MVSRLCDMSSPSVPSSSEIRQQFLDFFQSKQHTIVPSSSLMPDAPNLLFTNAGMNQFVPIFLGQQKSPYTPGRAADTQKCIRAGGKHNDLEDVGLDTYHHTFFEMLGNWSFGDYFKNEAIDWAWELITEVWKFPKERLYATVYNPDKEAGDPADFDQEAYDFWKEKFEAAGLDPKVHIVNGNKEDNFWMMGETGPCGPCSELHMDLTPAGDTKGSLVNKDSALCIEIWNLVFIQFNANQDGSFSDLPAKHVDTGMGFERVAAIMQGSKGFTDFSKIVSNYDTDVFAPIFEKLSAISGKQYTATIPKTGSSGDNEQEKIDVAFRVIADHIRTLSFAIADGIVPGNNDRNYVLKRILRRAVRYGRTLGVEKIFFCDLVDVLVEKMGEVFPELKERRDFVVKTIRTEEEAFNKTLDRGIDLFNDEAGKQKSAGAKQLDGDFAFKLYDTYGFPLDLTELMAREIGLGVDNARFDVLMEEQRDRARKARKSEVIEVADLGDLPATDFNGFESLYAKSEVQQVVNVGGKTAVVLDQSPFYAEMGGQLGDTGTINFGDQTWNVLNTIKSNDTWLHLIKGGDALPEPGDHVDVSVDVNRRHALERHHSVTHLLHWALHEVVSDDATQKGSYVGPEKLTFDFNSSALKPAQISDIEKLVNERIVENAPITWGDMPYTEVKDREDVMQMFGEKYGDLVRVVQVGGRAGDLDGYSMELCGGTHTRHTGEIGLFRIVSEAASSAGVRRIEGIAGLEAYQAARSDMELIQRLATSINSPLGELEKKVEGLLTQQKDLEKKLKSMKQKQSAEIAKGLLEKAQEINGTKAIFENMGEEDGDFLQAVAESLKAQFEGVALLIGAVGGNVALVAAVHPSLVKKVKAGDIIKNVAPILGGRGGGRPEMARGGGKDASKIGEVLAKAAELLG